VHLVALGDSLTEGDGDDGGGGFPARLELFLQGVRSGSTVRNLGRSGWTSEGLIQGVNGEPGQLSQALARLDEISGAKVATLWIGSNDLWYLYDARDEPMTDEQEQENLIAYTENVRTVVAQLHGAGARVLIGLLDDQSLRPVVANPPNPAEPAFPSISADDLLRMSQQVANYNAALRALAAETDNVAVVDFYNTTIFTDPATLADDGNHPNGAGYAAISAIWQSVLSVWLEEPGKKILSGERK
jgi:lysophospholipase L1-like esterase